jgi:hypothetical protein
VVGAARWLRPPHGDGLGALLADARLPDRATAGAPRGQPGRRHAVVGLDGVGRVRAGVRRRVLADPGRLGARRQRPVRHPRRLRGRAERRTSRWGYVLDSTVDRVNDVIYLAAVVSVGAPLELAIACGVGFFLLEYVRARAGNAGGDDVGTVTVGERPMRVIFLSASIHFGGVFVGFAETVATVGLSVMTAFTAVALIQLLVAVRRQLLALPADDRPPAVAPPGG